MAESKHTPGPWVGFSDQGKDIAILPAGRDGTICNFAEPYPSRADAQAMIAAPDLLEALQALDAQWSEDRPDGPETKARPGFPEMHETTKSVWRQIRAAIAKAMGGA